jgi:hypothetical protein
MVRDDHGVKPPVSSASTGKGCCADLDRDARVGLRAAVPVWVRWSPARDPALENFHERVHTGEPGQRVKFIRINVDAEWPGRA